MRKKAAVVLLAVFVIFAAAFAVKTCFDYGAYRNASNSAPFKVFVTVNELIFLLPAACSLSAAAVLMKKGVYLPYPAAAFAVWGLCEVFLCRPFVDGVIYALPPFLMAAVTGVCGIVSRKRRT